MVNAEIKIRCIGPTDLKKLASNRFLGSHILKSKMTYQPFSLLNTRAHCSGSWPRNRRVQPFVIPRVRQKPRSDEFG